MKKRAFTLIELLVVLAVISILAAVLFPVLQRAQRSARQSSCIAHFRQAGMAMGMYNADNDDQFVIAAHRPSMSAQSSNNKRWPQLVAPYVKEIRLFRCPSDPFPGALPSASFDPDLTSLNPAEYDYALAERTNVGYNYLYLAPIILGTNQMYQSTTRNGSELAKPSQTILAVDSVWQVSAAGRPAGGGSYLVVPPCRYATVTNADSFKLANATVFMQNEGWRKFRDQLVRFGGVWPWHDGRSTVIFTDGHAASRSPVQLSNGCTINATQFDGGIVDQSNYDWDLD